MVSPDHRREGWSAQEIMEALSLLSQNVENAIQMTNHRGLQLCEEALQGNILVATFESYLVVDVYQWFAWLSENFSYTPDVDRKTEV